MMAAIEKRRFEQPDQQLDMKEHGQINILKMHDGTAGMRAVFEPGWRWEVDEKPLIGNPDSCPASHTGYCLRGRLVVRMVASGVETHRPRRLLSRSPPGTTGTSRAPSASS
ncbi:MAG: cupin domain-containing protein [Deltaproteobacteria bacterium]|nr:cupin domain-containing protein [Deltaproteobacteria bacterium]